MYTRRFLKVTFLFALVLSGLFLTPKAQAQVSRQPKHVIEKLIGLALPAADDMTDKTQRQFCLQQIAEARLIAGDFTGARETTLAITDGNPTTSFRFPLFRRIATAQVKSIGIDEARDVASGIADADVRSSLLLAIAEAQARAADIESAGAIADSIPRE